MLEVRTWFDIAVAAIAFTAPVCRNTEVYLSLFPASNEHHPLPCNLPLPDSKGLHWCPTFFRTAEMVAAHKPKHPNKLDACSNINRVNQADGFLHKCSILKISQPKVT